MKKFNKNILYLGIFLIIVGTFCLGITYLIWGDQAITNSLYAREPSLAVQNAKSPIKKVNIETLNEKEQLSTKCLIP